MPEELEITIAQNGEIQVHVKGVKGKKCLERVEMIQQMLDRPEKKEQRLTGEYFEPDPKAKIAPTQSQERSV